MCIYLLLQIIDYVYNLIFHLLNSFNFVFFFLDRLGGRTLTHEIDIGDGQKAKFDLGGQWVASSQPDILEILEELNIETYPQFIDGTKVMQVGHNNVIRTYQSDIPSLGSFWGVIELQLFIWKVMRTFYFFNFFLSSKI